MTTGAEWGGAVGDVWAAEWSRTDRSFAALSPHLDAAILAAAPTTGRAVDLGCGAGQTSLALADARPDLDVLGVDVSPELVRIATERAAKLGNLRFTCRDVAADAAAIAAGAALLFSRHGVMFFDNPAVVFATLASAVAPRARLVFSCFRDGAANPWAGALVAAMTGMPPTLPNGYAPGPFGFADAARTRMMLEGAGWVDVRHEPIDYVYVAGAGDDPVADALSFLRQIGPVAAALRMAAEGDRAAMVERLTEVLTAHRTGGRVAFSAAAWLWTARAPL